jgi:hypothetical protein
MAKITFESKKVTLPSDVVAYIWYVKSQIEPIIGRGILSDIDVIRFCLNFFIRVDEAVEKVYDLLYKEVENNEGRERR